MFRVCPLHRCVFWVLLSCAVGFACVPLRAEKKEHEAPWIRVSSAHFSVLTDAGEKKGREVAVRFEQMRAEFAQLLMRRQLKTPVPVEIIALKGDDEYARVAPAYAASAPGFFLRGDDGSYVVLNLFRDDGWRAVSNDYAHLLLNYNYPPTQSWFDEGLAEYYSSLELDDTQAWIGGDPEMPAAPRESLPGHQALPRDVAKSLTELLNGPVWLGIPDLFTMRHDTPISPGASHSTLFYAQSWIVVHYLVNQNKLPETGTYFDLVENQTLPVEQAIKQAYGMSAEQFGQAVKDYFHSIEPKLQAPPTADRSRAAGELLQFPAPVTADVVGTSRQDMLEADGDALLAELEIRIPEHRDDAVKRLNSILSDPKTEDAAAHRALAWDDMERKQPDEAIGELAKALQIDPKDPWAHYYMALVKYRTAQASGGEVHGLANMMIDLKAVIDWYPEFAEAHHMLAMAQLEGGGAHAALDSIRVAVQLSPRNQECLLDMARIYVGGKKWDEATALLERLEASPNAKVASAARKDLADLPTLKKYGILPQHEAAPQAGAMPQAQAAPQAVQTPQAVQKASAAQPAKNGEENEVEVSEDHELAIPPQPDKRQIQFLKGKLLDVDCSQSPAAVLTVVSKTKRLKFRTENYQSLVLVGADKFSCGWKDRAVAVNFKAGGKSDGDLVSLEVQ
jgi:tetratricopeptide (TPR) repeat protein